jgi:hypothetical protein
MLSVTSARRAVGPKPEDRPGANHHCSEAAVPLLFFHHEIFQVSDANLFTLVFNLHVTQVI